MRHPASLVEGTAGRPGMGTAARSEAPGRAHSPNHHLLHPHAAAPPEPHQSPRLLGWSCPAKREVLTSTPWTCRRHSGALGGKGTLSRGRWEKPRSWAETAGQTNGQGEGETREETQARRLEDSA